MTSLPLKSPFTNRKLRARLAETELCRYIDRVNGLTKQEITVLSLIAALLLTGWFVKYYRAAHLPAATAPSAAH